MTRSLPIASSVESQRGSVGAMKCTSGISSSDASSTSESSACTNAWRCSLQPRSMIHAKISLRVVPSERGRRAGRGSVAILIARSIATQHISREWVKRWRPPRVSQMPSSGSCQCAQSQSMSGARLRQSS